MRILFITPYLPGPLRTRPFNFLKELSARHRITLLSPIFASEEEAAALELARTLPNLEIKTVFLPKLESIARSLLAGLTGQSMQAFFCYSSELVRAAREILQEGDFQLVHVEHYRAAFLGRELRSTTIPVVYDAVDSISLLVERTLRHGPLKQRLVSGLELGATRRYEGALISGGGFEQVCATSREDATALTRLAGPVNPGRRNRSPGEEISPVTVIPNGVNIAEFTPPPPNFKRHPATAIFTGKMSYHANAAAARYLVKEIWPRVRLAHQEARLLIVGSNPPEDLLAQSGRYGIEVTGYVPDLSGYLKMASVSVSPLVYSVGIQNKVLEAMACATPTIASAQISRSINARDGQELLLVPDHQPAAFARRILDLFENPDQAARLGQAGRDFVVREHTWERASRQLEDLWEAALVPQAVPAALVS
ncbi:MAG: glycosyltransferase [Chloroflexi bacterium]|nr:glycosyltransferase [Chloroflexota bacterium]OJW03406.1 MAG: hypothetical protein BGO39_10375 [Chloroflexi bacterium 54-19]